jgi:hypothetical protein
MRTRTSLLLLLGLVLPLPARADWIRILPGSVDRVVANAERVAAARGREVWIFRDDGSVSGRVGKRGGTAASARPTASHKEAEEIWDVLGISDLDRDEDWAFDLLDDERTLAQRRRARPGTASPTTAAAPPPILAATANELWIAADDAILRLGRDGDLVRERARRGTERGLAAATDRLLLARPDGLALLSLAGGEDQVLPLPAGAGKIALSASGQRWAFAGAAGVVYASVGARSETLLPASAALDLAFCGETLVVLLADALWAIPPGEPPELRSRELRAHRLSCPSPSPGPWLAVGQALLVSVDEGRQWASIATPPGLAIADVATSAHHLWLATAKGLYFTSDGAGPASTHVAMAAPTARPRRRRSAASWWAWLPKVSVRAAATLAPAEHQVEGLALAQFPLEPNRIPVVAAAYEDGGLPLSEPASVRPTERSADLPDLDLDCLSLARRRAVELAMTEPERAQSYVTRAGRAAWLPELRVLVSRRYGRSESIDLDSSSTALSSPLGIDTVNDIRYEARATWDLAKLVFSTEELAAQNQALHMAELRRDIQNTVNRLYFERRRLALDVASAPASNRHLRTREIEAELDALSGGAFGACALSRAEGR